MRLIAQLTLYNGGDVERLRAFITSSYTEAALQEQGADERLAQFAERLATIGRLRVRQVIATDKHRAIALLNAENSDHLYMNEIEVEADYPHRILHFSHIPMGVEE